MMTVDSYSFRYVRTLAEIQFLALEVAAESLNADGPHSAGRDSARHCGWLE